MQILSIHLTDFRGFDDKRFEFNPHFNVLVGENGKGKTSILEALVVAINSYVSVIEGRNVRGIKKEDVRRVSYGMSVESKLNTSLHITGKIHDEEVKWSIGKPQLHWGYMKMNDKELKNYAKKTVSIISDNGGKGIVLPLFDYLGCGRLWTESTEKVKTFPKGSRLQGYNHCLSSKGSFKQFAEWFKTMELSALQDNESAKMRAEVIKKVVANCLEGWDTIFYSIEDDMLMARKGSAKNRQFLPFSYLSDGQRNIIGIVADIAYRCVILNPYLEMDATLKTPGIVLIDELDLHLHPNWQKKIVKNLKENFPSIQFITTSHSPFIVQSLKGDELISLDKHDAISEPFRKSIEEVAEEDMAVENVLRSTRFQEMETTATKYYDLIESGGDQNSINKLKLELDSLEELYGDDPAFVALLRAERKSSSI